MDVDLTRWFSPKQIEQLEPLLADAKSQGWHHWIRTRSDYQAVLEGCYFDESAARRFVQFAGRFIVQVNGRFKRQPSK